MPENARDSFSPSYESSPHPAMPGKGAERSARRRLPFALILLCGLLLGVTLISVDHHSDSYRQTQIELTRLHGLLQQAHAFEEEAIAEQEIPPEKESACQQVLQEMETSIRELQLAQPEGAFLKRIGLETSAYSLGWKEELPFIKNKKIEQAEIIAEQKVDPPFTQLVKDIQAADSHYNLRAQRFNLMADISTLTLLLVSALAMGIFLRYSERTQQEAARRQMEQEALHRSSEHVRTLICNVSDIVLVTDRTGKIQYVNDTIERVLAYPVTALEERLFQDLVHPEDQLLDQRLRQEAFKSVQTTQGELRLRHQDGQWRVCEVLLTNLLENPQVQGLLVTCRDITERKALETQIAHQAFHDALTGLPNRALFMDRLASALARTQRQDSTIGLIFVDLDNFKVINDSMGHEAGDHLLNAIAERLQSCTRPGDTVARLGGDEFTLLLDDIHGEEDATLVAERILEQLHLPISLAGKDIFGSASIGIALSSPECQDPDALMRNADAAMYQAKTGGKSTYVLFDPEMHADINERLLLEQDLRIALSHNEFRILYQPIVALETGNVCEVEALLRWEHPVQGTISPVKFIPIAEESGLIIPIGKWVLEQACSQAREWDKEGTYPELIVSVNISARQLQQANFVEVVATILKETGMTPNRLKLEVTESLMMQDMEGTAIKLQQIKALGVRLAVDDFGTGYSSLAYLEQFPFDTLKIDRTFIQRLGTEEHGSVIQAIINLAKTLNLQVTSEGIETVEQRNQLQEMGSHFGQGYYFAHPLTQGNVDKLLSQSDPLPASQEESKRTQRRAA